MTESPRLTFISWRATGISSFGFIFFVYTFFNLVGGRMRKESMYLACAFGIWLGLDRSLGQFMRYRFDSRSGMTLEPGVSLLLCLCCRGISQAVCRKEKKKEKKKGRILL